MSDAKGASNSKVQDEATAQASRDADNLVRATASDHILDIGSGIGGPARYFANRFGCRVTGIDLTPEFCDVVWPLNLEVT